MPHYLNMRLSPPLRASPIGIPTDIALNPVLGGPWTHRFAQLDGIQLHYVEAGAGPLVVLLHGFPDFWLVWRRQIAVLADAGFRVVAPDLRGFNLSDKPRHAGAYASGTTADDIAALITHVGAPSASVVGHDIGGAVAWALARRRPDLVERLVAINAPPSWAFRSALRHAAQLRRSWYMFFFALPLLPELVLRARGASLIARIHAAHAVRSGAFPEEELDAYRAAALRPGAMRGMLNHYRAMLQRAFGSPIRGLLRARRVLAGDRRTAERSALMNRPALVLWADEEPFLEPALVAGAARWGANVRVRRIANAGHWAMVDAPTETNRAILEFLTAR